MTAKETKLIEDLLLEIRNLRADNTKFREDVTKQVTAINTKVDQKHMPLSLEGSILSSVTTSMQEAIKKILIDDYNSPLKKLITSVVDDNSVEVKKLINDAFTQVIRTEDFKEAIVLAFSHKVAKTIISNNDSIFDKVSNELKSDHIFKAKMQLAVANVVEECLPRRQHEEGL